MYKNYFYQNRSAIELQNILKEYFLTEAFSQEKDRIILRFAKNNENKFLIISVNQNLPFVSVKDEFHRAKKNTINFFEEFFPAEINSVKIAEADRIIQFDFSRFQIYFLIKGKDTNLILIKENDLHSFKKITGDERSKLIDEISSKNFIDKFEMPEIQIEDENLQRSFPYLGKEIINEFKLRNSFDEYISIKDLINEIFSGKISIFYDDILNKVVFAPENFKIFYQKEPKIFDSFSSAFNFYLIKKFQLEKVIDLKKRIGKYLEQNLEKLSSKLNEIKFKIDSPSKEIDLRNTANLLLANLYKIQKGMKVIELENFYDENKIIKIKLNETLDANQNAERYFEKAKNEKQSRNFLAELFKQLSLKREKYLFLKDRFEKSDTAEELSQIFKELNLNANNENQNYKKEKFNFKHYIIENKYHVYVGKDSTNNDELTTKFAKQNDIWFHARGVPGSHLILRVENSKEVVPKNIIKLAASIAAYHSKAKTAKTAPVAYTFKKFVVKRKGMEPGKVALLKEDVVLVTPEIPASAEYVSESEF